MEAGSSFTCALCPNRTDLKQKCCCADSETGVFPVTDSRLIRRANLRQGDRLCAFHYDKLKKGMIFGGQNSCCAPFHVATTPGKRLRSVPRHWRSLFNNAALSPRYMPSLQICDSCYQITLDIMPNGGNGRYSEDESDSSYAEPASPNSSYRSPRRWMSTHSLHHVDAASEPGNSSSVWSPSPRQSGANLMSMYNRRHNSSSSQKPAAMPESIRRFLHSKSLDACPPSSADSEGSNQQQTPRSSKLVKRTSSKSLFLSVPPKKIDDDDVGRLCYRIQDRSDFVSKASLSMDASRSADLTQQERVANKLADLAGHKDETRRGELLANASESEPSVKRPQPEILDHKDSDITPSVADSTDTSAQLSRGSAAAGSLNRFSHQLATDVVQLAIEALAKRNKNAKETQHVEAFSASLVKRVIALALDDLRASSSSDKEAILSYAASLSDVILADVSRAVGRLENVCACCGSEILQRCESVLAFARSQAERIMSKALYEGGDGAVDLRRIAMAERIVSEAVESALGSIGNGKLAAESLESVRSVGSTKVEWDEDKRRYRTVFSVEMGQEPRENSGDKRDSAVELLETTAADSHSPSVRFKSGDIETVECYVEDLVPITRSLSSGFLDSNSLTGSDGAELRRSSSNDSIFVMHCEPVEGAELPGDGGEEVIVLNLSAGPTPSSDETFRPKPLRGDLQPESPRTFNPPEIFASSPPPNVAASEDGSNSEDADPGGTISIVTFYPTSSEDGSSSLGEERITDEEEMVDTEELFSEDPVISEDAVGKEEVLSNGVGNIKDALGSVQGQTGGILVDGDQTDQDSHLESIQTGANKEAKMLIDAKPLPDFVSDDEKTHDDSGVTGDKKQEDEVSKRVKYVEEEEDEFDMKPLPQFYAPAPTAADLVREHMPAARRRVTQFLRAASDAELVRNRNQSAHATRSKGDEKSAGEAGEDAEPTDVADVLCDAIEDATPHLLRHTPSAPSESGPGSRFVWRAMALLGVLGVFFYAGWKYYYID